MNRVTSSNAAVAHRRLRYFRTMKLLAIVLSWTPGPPAGATPLKVTVYSTNIAPFYDDRNGGSGAIFELLQLAAPVMDVELEIRPLPFKREFAMLSRQPDMLALMWRLPEVEDSRQWMVKLLSERLFLVTRQDAKVNIDRLQQAKKLRVGVLLGGPAEMVLRQMGFTNIDAVSSPESNARKLAIGRIDAWAAFRSVAEVEQRRIGSSVSALRFGVELQRIDLYLTCRPGMERSSSERWRQAFEQLRRNGRYEQIMYRYQLAVPSTEKR